MKAGEIIEKRVIELSKLPAWPGLSSASASVGLPQGTEALVKVVLNKEADSWCNLSDLNDKHLPAAVLREQGYLKIPPAGELQTPLRHGQNDPFSSIT